MVIRQLKAKYSFNWSMRRSFKHGIYVRRKLGVHRHVVQYLGQGGPLLQPYEVIEYIHGPTLKSMIVRHHAALQKSPVVLLKAIVEAVIHTHARGFVHLDIKPENILVQFHGQEPEIKLTDFDLSQPLSVTKVRKGCGGSLSYLPPEYLKDKQVSVSTDYFAVGVLAYNMFTGDLPWMGSVMSLMKANGYEISYPNSRMNLVTPAVKKFINTCLAPWPEARFRDDLALRQGVLQLEKDYASEVPPPPSSPGMIR